MIFHKYYKKDAVIMIAREQIINKYMHRNRRRALLR
jgi:hypothetical protein